MAKFSGYLGFAVTEEVKPGIWKDNTTEKIAYGDILRCSRRNSPSEHLNDDINISNQISIVANVFVRNNYQNLKYIKFKNAETKWKVTDIELQFPRILLTIGGVYNNGE